MPIRGPLIPPGLRRRIGDDVLAGARAIDTSLVKDRLARFERAHGRYVEAQDALTAIERELRAARARLAGSNAALRTAVTSLAGGLIGEGHSLRQPFATFGTPSRTRLSRLPLRDRIEAVRRLVDRVRRQARVGELTARTAPAAIDAASAVERDSGRVEKIERRLRDARTRRDAIRVGWHTAYVALKHVARAAGVEGAPEIHAALFARRVGRRTKRAVDTKPPGTAVAPPAVSGSRLAATTTG